MMKKCTLPVLEMSCAVCANNVENKVNSLSGVTSASVNFAANTITIEYDPEQITLPQIKAEVQSIGYDLVIDEENQEDIQEEAQKKPLRSLKKKSNRCMDFVYSDHAPIYDFYAYTRKRMDYDGTYFAYSALLRTKLLYPCVETDKTAHRQYGHFSSIKYIDCIFIQPV